MVLLFWIFWADTWLEVCGGDIMSGLDPGRIGDGASFLLTRLSGSST